MTMTRVNRQLDAFLAADAAALAAEGLTRQLRKIDGRVGPAMVVDGQSVLMLAGNNCLDLSADDRIAAAAADAARKHGSAAGGSRLIAGNLLIHEAFEEELAGFLRTEAALLFSSGYMCNLGIITALVGKDDVVVSDSANHASIVDACRLSHAAKRVFRHNSPADLRRVLAECRSVGFAKTLLVIEGVHSMFGDLTSLQEITAAAADHGAIVLLDDTHGVGVLGPSGRGVAELHGCAVDLLVGNLSKAFGCFGAFVGCSAAMRRFLINRSRNFIFTCALPPPAVAAGRAALRLLVEEPWRRQRVALLAGLLRTEFRKRGFNTGPSNSHIVPLIVGDNDAAMDLCNAALRNGIFSQGIRYPTVPKGQALLRFCPMASMTEENMVFIAETIERIAATLNIRLTSKSENANNNNIMNKPILVGKGTALPRISPLADRQHFNKPQATL